ncbi:ShlB/FhaC/HecB family hemolysin secretion/activation protein [Sphingomonas hengshuiensis]|uniref:ShlB/FhaC/HecB family hemolysin secretion/activation protein n=1 Tax=Sphingomonas hengshuiensis TaxID=1609977 RepID=UPI000695CBDA|nr:ShlB/FhaC/HecB family hemolysin secretion/activation protein [Sphingomonas hengshuiensis]
MAAASGQARAQDEPPAQSAPQPETPPERLVDVYRYRVLGNSTLPRTEMERAVLPYLGPKRTISDIEAARAALEKAYRDRGFETVAVEIPQQDVRGGVVAFQVVELSIGQVRVVGARHFSPQDLRDRLPELKEGTVPNYGEVSRQLALANRSALRSITPTLRRGAAPDTVDVDLNVEESSPFSGTIELNDRTSSRTRRLRVAGSLSYNNLFQREHSLNLQGQFSPEAPSESWVASASYVVPVLGTPLSFVAYGVHSDSDVTAVGGIGVIGTGDIAGLRALYSFASGDPASAWQHQLTLGLDYKNFTENLVVGSDSANTPIDYVPLTAQYALARHQPEYDFDMSLTLTAGLRGLDATEREFRLKRYNASANWLTLRAEAGYLHRLRGDWRVGTRFAGQFAGRPLIANEQFSIGGLESVRGYYESHELGDDGASVQFQVDTPNIAPAKWMDQLRLFAFTDAGLVRIYDPLSDQNASTGLVSVGAGLTLRAFGRVNLSTLLAAPLLRPGSTVTDAADSVRAQVRLWTQF